MRTRYHCRAGMALVCLFIMVAAVPLSAQLPDPGMDIEQSNTALVITDPQNDFLSPDGVMWGVVGQSVTENNTVENIDRLFRSAKRAGLKDLHFQLLNTGHFALEEDGDVIADLMLSFLERKVK